MVSQIQQRRDTAVNWNLNNPILATGEIGFESDTDKFKIGDGINTWNSITTYFHKNKIMELDDNLGTDHTYEGIIIEDTVGEAVVFGNLLYMKSDGKWWKTSSAVASGAEFPVTAMAVATISADASGKLLLNGTVRNDTWNFTTLGKVYCGVDVPTHTQPTTSGYTVQIVGISLDVDQMYFNPDNTYVELT